MLNLARNTSMVWYRLFTGREDIVDEFGNIMGTEPVYSQLEACFLNIMQNNSNISLNAFGSLRDYDRIATTSDTNCPIDEGAILWVDDADTQNAHNCVVLRRAPWKNSIAFALKMVEVADG